jgi:hypothetical protein
VAAVKSLAKPTFQYVVGDKQSKAVQRVLEEALLDALCEFEEHVSPDMTSTLRPPFEAYFADNEVVDLLLGAAITRERPDERRLRERFCELGLDESTLPIDLGAFISAFSFALQERIRAEVSKPDSPLSNLAMHTTLEGILDAVRPPTPASTASSLDLDPQDEDDTQCYKEWLARRTSSFSVPGLGVALPIDTAWLKLRVHGDVGWEGPPPDSLAKWLEVYREWSRLAERGGTEDKVLDAEQLFHFARLSVTIGGPGAGKSTLLRRLAYRLATTGEKVLLVRLPAVLRAMERGERFEEAVVKFAADGSGLDEATARRVLRKPDYLLADGLDECDPKRQQIAEALKGWTEGHPETKVIVTTRPVGHDPALLPGWGYLELLPLAKSRIREHAQRLMEVIALGGEADIEELLDSFERSLEESTAASLAARNPLLLGFLVQLFVSGRGFGSSRAEVYRRIIDQIQEHPPHDRDITAEVDAALARHALEAMGWILQHHPELSRRDLVEKLGYELARKLDILPLQGKLQAEKCIRFWEERRLVEQLTFGSENAVQFVHLALAEYAAGSFASQMNDEDLCDWVRDVRREPRWRETVLLAAGAGAAARIARQLLELDDTEDLAAVETELALAVLAEAPESFPKLIREAADHLRTRLLAPVPFVAFEAAEAAVGLAAQAPELVGPVVRALTNHPQEWTRLSAIRLSLACGGQWADLDSFEAYVDGTAGGAPSTETPEDQRLGQRQGFFTWGLENEMLVEGIELLIQERPSEETNRRVEQVYLGDRIGMGTQDRLSSLLSRHGGYDELIEELYRRAGYTLVDVRNWLSREQKRRDKDLAILEVVLRAIDAPDGARLPEPNGELTSLSKLIYGMGWPEATPRQWDVMRERYDLEAVDAVFRGAIAAMELDPSQLGAEAALAEKRFKEDEGLAGRLLNQTVELPVSPRWELALGADIPATDLVRSLKHPSAPIVTNAVMLIEHGVGGSEVPELLKAVAESGTEYTSHAVGYLAPKVWGEEALEILLEILGNDPITRDNYGLVLVLPELPRSWEDERVHQVLLRGLGSEDPHVATKVAEELDSSKILELRSLAPQLGEALEHWTTRGTWCDRHEIAVHGGSCPRCSLVPPSPRAHLVSILAKLGQLEFEKLAELSADPRSDVKDAAIESLVNVASSSPPILEDLLGRVSREVLSMQVLDQVFSLPPAHLQAAKVALIGLLDVPSAAVRERVLQAMAALGWIERDEVIALAKEALQDSALIVRDQAVRTLRSVRTP